MVRFTALLALYLGALAVEVVASPFVVRDSVVTLPLARRTNATGIRNVVARDQARAKILKARSQADRDDAGDLQKLGINVPLTDAIDTYSVDVNIGTPPTTYTCIVDTGSSNTWVGAGQAYVITDSSVDTGDFVVNPYSLCLQGLWC